MNPYIQVFLVWLWELLDIILVKYANIKNEYRKRWGDWKWINLETTEPQILHVYYVRNGTKIEPWGCDVYRRWNKRLVDKKVIRGSEWYIPQYIQNFQGIVVVYRFRDHEWVDSVNWVRELESDCLNYLRDWSFPRWNANTWKEAGRVRFPVGLQLNEREIDLQKWRCWFGPESRRERLIGNNIKSRGYEVWFDLKTNLYLLDIDDLLKVDLGVKEETYQWPQNNEKKEQ